MPAQGHPESIKGVEFTTLQLTRRAAFKTNDIAICQMGRVIPCFSHFKCSLGSEIAAGIKLFRLKIE
jgi:hypothetical protein